MINTLARCFSLVQGAISGMIGGLIFSLWVSIGAIVHLKSPTPLKLIPDHWNWTGCISDAKAYQLAKASLMPTLVLYRQVERGIRWRWAHSLVLRHITHIIMVAGLSMVLGHKPWSWGTNFWCWDMYPNGTSSGYDGIILPCIAHTSLVIYFCKCIHWTWIVLQVHPHNGLKMRLRKTESHGLKTIHLPMQLTYTCKNQHFDYLICDVTNKL